MSALRAVLLAALLIAMWWVGARPGSYALARERGAQIGEDTAKTAAVVRESVGEAAITSKIKAKMALDDHVRARSIDVSTSGSTVTLTGAVRSAGERERAVRLAKDTNGVVTVIDRLDVRP